MLKSKNYFWGGLLFLLFTSQVSAQENNKTDTSQWVQLKEIVVLAHPNLSHLKQAKPLSSIGEYLEESHAVNMIKRGAYAWEPNLNGMSSERLSITIDGMQIFGACTDKMDPITAYVDVSNLSEAHISHGQAGSEFGNTIGGALDLKLKKGNFKSNHFKTLIETGYETNSKLKTGGVAFGYENNRFYLNSSFNYKDADNYKDGNHKEVLFSQFTKLNTSIMGGFNFKNGRFMEASFIYDKATDVGYPALTMDVSLAQAYIASLSYHQEKWGGFYDWETKIYWNDIKHVMDDTTRPDVSIHMDMPGWSTTYGAFSKIKRQWKNHQLKINLNGYLNQSKAEMTMYPEDPNENLMYMLTWPDVQSINTAIYLEDNLKLANWDFAFNFRLAYHQQQVQDDFGLNSLKIFYPNIEKKNSRYLKSINSKLHKQIKALHFDFGLGYGERAPSVSEAYGFYLFNSFDNYDYVGNPDLPNEKSFESNLKISYHQPKWELGMDAKVFYIQDYIIGKLNQDYAPMTIGASGIKIYENLPHAILSNFSLFTSYQVVPHLTGSASIAYNLGRDDADHPLPLIRPMAYQISINYNNAVWSFEAQLKGAATQTEFSSSYGEDETPAYQLIHLSGGKLMKFGSQSLMLKAGIENLLNEHYSTFSDWNNIPRKGRNIFINLSYKIQ